MNFTQPGLLQRHTSEKTKSPLLAAGTTRGDEPASSVHEVLRSPGQPLDATTRDFMESRFGHDFSGVRLHTDAHADISTRAVSAHAYTVNQHIAFRSGSYSPQTPDGRKLIAHELTHTLQQRETPPSAGHELAIDDSHGTMEKQAEQSERFAAESKSPSPKIEVASRGGLGSALPLIQRQPTPAPTSDPARYQQTHDALFTPPAKPGASPGPATKAPAFDSAAQATTKGQFEKWITDLKKKNPRAFLPDLPNNTDKDNADKSTIAMDQQLRARFPQIAQPIPQATLLSHISIMKDADVAKDDFLRQWLAERLTRTDIATYQLDEKDPVYKNFLGDILADKKLGPLIRELARHKGAYIEESPDGTRDVRLNQGLDSSQRDLSLIHELVHFYAHASYKAWVDTTSNPRFFGEGFTEILARKAMTPDQLKANGSSYQDRVDQINQDISPRIPEDDLAQAYFAGEVWRIEFKSNAAQQAFKKQTSLDPAAKSGAEKKQSQTSAGIVQIVARGVHYRFLNLGEETAGPKPEHKAFFTALASGVVKDPTAQLRFVGHTSSAGNQAVSDKLSLAQAAAFYKMARDVGVPEAQLVEIKAPPHAGKSQPTAGNEDVIGRAFNRRVELFISHGPGTGGAPQGSTSTTAPAGDTLQRKADASAQSVDLAASGYFRDFSRVPAKSTLETARSGVSRADNPLPHATEIQRAFGRHSLADVKSQVGGPAHAATQSIGAVAYAIGNRIAFANTPNLGTAAHEAAHVVQQRNGVDLPGGVGASGDRYEEHANVVASLVARGLSAESVLDRSPGGGAGSGVHRLAFINEVPLKKPEKDFTSGMKRMIADSTTRNYLSVDEFKKHSEKQTDYLGSLADGTWMRFSPTGINLLGEKHTEVTLEESVVAVGSRSFIYEPFSSDKMTAGSNFQGAYEKENSDRFKRMGVDKEKDRQQFGEESLLPKMGYNLAALQPFFDGTSDIVNLKSGAYFGQPAQRYLKIAWAWSKDNRLDVGKKLKAGTFVPPKFKKLAEVHAAVEGKLGKFITTLAVDGYLGDELDKTANRPLVPLLADFGRAFTEAMMRAAADAPSSRLSTSQRTALTGSRVSSEEDKAAMFTQWRDFLFEDNVAAATKRGVRYAGMGQAHLRHLLAIGLEKNQHPFEMAGKDMKGFRDLTKKLEKTGKP